MQKIKAFYIGACITLIIISVSTTFCAVSSFIGTLYVDNNFYECDIHLEEILNCSNTTVTYHYYVEDHSNSTKYRCHYVTDCTADIFDIPEIMLCSFEGTCFMPKLSTQFVKYLTTTCVTSCVVLIALIVPAVVLIGVKHKIFLKEKLRKRELVVAS